VEWRGFETLSDCKYSYRWRWGFQFIPFNPNRQPSQIWLISEDLERRKKMLKFLSKVKIEFNALDPRVASCMEFLAQCNARKAKESNPACQVLVKRRTDDFPPQITVTFVNGVEEAFDATSTPAQAIRTMILEKGQLLETEQMFREAGEKWPVIIPEEELHQFAPGTKVSACWLYLVV
jgi:large subunit ribosomal protein L53